MNGIYIYSRNSVFATTLAKEMFANSDLDKKVWNLVRKNLLRF